jgi:pyrimidine operon attenuation protein/uracil phosphoribosyltransferase
MEKRQILNNAELEVILHRLALELREDHKDLEHTAIIGLQPRGIELAKIIHSKLSEVTGSKSVRYGELDSTFYRDDYRRSNKPLIPNTISLDFDIEDKDVIIIDDVLYTGRSVRSALNAMADFGRPRHTSLLCLIDRRYNRELPIQPDYVGLEVDTRANDRVLVDLKERQKEVWILTDNK